MLNNDPLKDLARTKSLKNSYYGWDGQNALLDIGKKTLEKIDRFETNGFPTKQEIFRHWLTPKHYLDMAREAGYKFGDFTRNTKRNFVDWLKTTRENVQSGVMNFVSNTRNNINNARNNISNISRFALVRGQRFFRPNLNNPDEVVRLSSDNNVDNINDIKNGIQNVSDRERTSLRDIRA